MAYPSGVREKIVIFEGPAWDAASREVKDLISGLMKWKPSQRLTAEAAGRSPWVERYREALRAHPSMLMKHSFGATGSLRGQYAGGDDTGAGVVTGDGNVDRSERANGGQGGAATGKVHGSEVESTSMSFDTHDPRFNANAALSVVGDGEMDVVGRGKGTVTTHGEISSAPSSPTKDALAGTRQRGQGDGGGRRESAKRTFSKVGQGCVGNGLRLGRHTAVGRGTQNWPCRTHNTQLLQARPARR